MHFLYILFVLIVFLVYCVFFLTNVNALIFIAYPIWESWTRIKMPACFEQDRKKLLKEKLNTPIMTVTAIGYKWIWLWNHFKIYLFPTGFETVLASRTISNRRSVVPSLSLWNVFLQYLKIQFVLMRKLRTHLLPKVLVKEISGEREEKTECTLSPIHLVGPLAQLTNSKQGLTKYSPETSPDWQANNTSSLGCLISLPGGFRKFYFFKWNNQHYVTFNAWEVIKWLCVPHPIHHTTDNS